MREKKIVQQTFTDMYEYYVQAQAAECVHNGFVLSAYLNSNQIFVKSYKRTLKMIWPISQYTADSHTSDENK